VRVTDLLCKLETEEQVFEHTGAFIQLYREDARYLERTAPWIDRVGLAHVKRRIVDDAGNRAALFERFKFAQQFSQRDPWSERATTPEHQAEYTPMKELAGP